MFWPILAILFVVPLVALYFVVIRSVDRYAPEPWWLLYLCLVWGAVGAVIPSVAGGVLGQEALATTFDSLEAEKAAELVENTTATFVAPMVEEPSKAFGLLLIYFFSRRRVHETHGPLSGVVYGGIIGLGFTLTEDILYIVGAAQEFGGKGFFGMYFVRTMLLGLGHATFTALAGLGFGLFVTTKGSWRWAMPFAGLGLAMLLHGGRNLFSSFLILEGAGLWLALMLHAMVVVLFFILLLWLGFRDRARVKAGLEGVVGSLITQAEYNRILSPWMLLPGWNLMNLTGLPGGYRLVREKQLNCFRLAFIRNRVRNERNNPDTPPVLDPVENEAIAAIEIANQRGVMLAPSPMTQGPPVMS